MKKLLAPVTSEKGLEPTEYAPLRLGIFLVVINAVLAFGDHIAGLYNKIVQGFSAPL